MGTPTSNPEGYRASSVITHVDRLSGKLLLVHGLLDENVHFRHSARLMQALIDKQAPFDVLLYPNERHLPRSLEDRVAMETRILEYFMTYLTPASSISSREYDTSPFESAAEIPGTECRNFKQNPFKPRGMCSNCFEVHE